MNENKIKIEEFKNNITTLKGAVKNLEPEYEKNSKLFHSKKEVEDLYQNISKFALINGLSITNLKKGEPKAVVGDPQAQTQDKQLKTVLIKTQQLLKIQKDKRIVLHNSS